MEGLIITALIIIVIVLVGGVIIILNKLKAIQKPTEDKALLLLQNQMQDLTKGLDQKFGMSSKLLQDQFIEMSKLTRDTTEKLTKLDETNKQVLNFSDQLKNLQDILKNPKQRGILGEYFLEQTLKSVLPPESYVTQFHLGKDDDGQELIVDAVVKASDGLIPVDAKFSIENYNRLVEATSDEEREKYEKVFVNDLKKRIQETGKYIRPDKGTLDFAFMFIPHEAIYYDLLINKVGSLDESSENLIQRAASKYRVIIVSPTNLLAYLQTVLFGLRALKFDESAKQIRKNVELMQKHLINYDAFYKKLGTQLNTVVGTYETTKNEFKKIDKDVMKITEVESGLEDSPMLDKPRLDD
jgi:DNA recombination protein RmuC